MKVTVYRYGRFNGRAGEYDMVCGRLATKEKIEALNADSVGLGIEVDSDWVCDGWFTVECVSLVAA